MQTKELEQTLQRLDNIVLETGQMIQNMRNYISQCDMQAISLEEQANRMIARASYTENAEEVQELYAQAAAYTNMASEYRMQAEQIQLEMEAKIAELRGYKSEYEYYLKEGQKNISCLQITAEKLTGMTRTKYGGSQIKETLLTTKQRIVYNQNLVQGCQKRINWIDRICGAEDDTYKIKVKKR